MIGELLLAAALGQSPAPPVAPSGPPRTMPAVPLPATSGPLTSSTGERLVPNGDGTYRIDAGPAAGGSNGTGSSSNGAAGNGSTGTGTPGGNDAEKKENQPAAEDPKPPTKYLVEQLLDQSPAGQLLSDRGLKIYGWAAMNYTGGSSRRTNLPTTFNDRDNAYQLNQNYLVLEKGIDTTKKEVQYGFQTDMILPGTDARFTLARGLLDSQLRNGTNGGPRNYPIDLYQAYGQVYLPNVGEGTTVKVGKFATHLEYEVAQATLTPFVSRSYLFQYNPFTHTGVWATTQLNDDWSVSNGAAVGNDNFIDPTNRATYLGQLKWAPKGGKTTALLGVSVTNPRFDTAENFPNYNVYNFQLIQKVTDKFTYVFDGSFSHIDNAPGSRPSTNWFGGVNYLIYQVTDKLTSTLRVELFNDSSGFRTGTEGLYTAVTYGLAYTPVEAVILRPFVRYDHNRNGPFEGKDNLVTGGLEAILRY